MIAGFYAPKNTFKRVQKIKINATQNNSVPLELGKQHQTGEKKEWLDRPAKFQPKFGHFQEDNKCMPRSQLRRSFGFFLICPNLVEDSKTGLH